MSSPSLVGKLLAGRYHLIECLGRGVTGDVYLAKHPVLGVRFAVKVLGEEYSDDVQATSRLKHEAELVSRLNHPNIVSTVDFGETDDRRFYIIMEYVHGHSLKKELRRLEPSLMPLKRVLNLLKQLCHGLTTAHDAGVIHRAIKPANVLLSVSPSGDEQVKLVNFGMAKTISDDGQSHVTRNRQIIGSPRYMAPEQLTGAPVDRRADVYSVGVIAYVMLTGDLPFYGQTPIQVVAAQQSKPAAVLSLMRPADETKVPRDCEKVFMQCLEIDRENRPRHVSHLTEAILMALPRVPDEEERPVTITKLAGSQDEAQAWSEGLSNPADDSVGPDDTAEVDLADLEKVYQAHFQHQQERKLNQLTPEQKSKKLWNVVNKKALDLANLLEQHRLASGILSSHLITWNALAEQEVATQTEIALHKEALNETDDDWREKTAPVRDALLNLRVAHSRLMEDQATNATILTALDQQIDELEARLGAATQETEDQQRKLENHVLGLQNDLQTIEHSLGETQLQMLQILRQDKRPGMPAEIEEGYATLENLLRHV
jgi:serine/threonine-protein kinase